MTSDTAIPRETQESGPPTQRPPTQSVELPRVIELKDTSNRTSASAESGFEDLSATRRKLNAQAAGNASLELEHLRKLLSAQDAAKQQAQSAAAELHKQLKVFENENGRIRNDLKRSQDQLTLAKQEHEKEIRRAADRETGLANELLHARAQASEALEKVSGDKKKWAAILLGLAAPALVWAAVAHWHSAGPASPDTREVSADPVAASPRLPASKAPASPDFSAALGRLDQALNSFSGEQPEEVLRRVHMANAIRGVEVCSFAWNNGEVSLQLGSKSGMGLDTAMTECADAVEKAAK